MKKSLLFFAFLAGMAICNVACSSDDDGDKTEDKGNTKTGKYEKEAAQFTMTKENAPKATTETEDEVAITGFTLTEYGDGILEIDINGKKKYKTYDVVAESNVFKLYEKGNFVGTIEKEATKAEDVTLVFNLTISIEINGELVTQTFDDAATAQMKINAVIDNLTKSLTNSWTVERMKLTIYFDDKNKKDVSATSEGGDLKPFIELADDNDVEINDNDRKELDRNIEKLIIESGNVFVLKYKDNRADDRAEWNWVNKSEGNLAIGIKLKGESEGNKFFNNDSKIGVELRSGNKVNLILTTRLEDDKCTGSLIVNLK